MTANIIDTDPCDWNFREKHIWDPIKSINFGENWVCGLFLNSQNDQFFVSCLAEILFGFFVIMIAASRTYCCGERILNM